MAKARARDVGEEALDAVVVESQAIDQRVGLRQAEHARLWVARLRSGVTVPHSMKPKPSVGKAVDVRGVLVEARGQADPIGERRPIAVDR